MRFSKLHGAGNDFVFLTSETEPADGWQQTARALCHRQTGIGADGLVRSTVLDMDPPVLDVTVYNADGSLATMCGNALRCAAWRAYREHGLTRMTLVLAGVKHEALVRVDDVQVTAEVGQVDMRRVMTVWDGHPVWFHSAYTGTEHVVAMVPDVDGIDAVALGRLVRGHPDLAPLGANVNFVQHTAKQVLRIRTYERGVEAETLSCGSGAVAAVVIATMRGVVAPREVTVHNRSGVPLTVRPHTNRPGRAFWVAGPVTEVYEGTLA